ncbi:odorant receptor 42b-like isoform X2 [Coccinella septempunctata]|uniref:odorant receptor 42b-like isoform X2 n=1 Tax=Coccinella septempunctata TaxID=41139 RepID=UPI001D06EEEF|nr:odorant receptor 42b-like isoform X2 [Coccinella septempunctata]
MIMLSITEYDVYFNHSVDGFILLVIWFIPAILFCECGDLLSDEYAKLKWAVYGMNWYDMPPEVRKTFIIFLGSVQKPIHLTAPPMFQFNRETFLQIMKGSYSFLMYLRGFVDKN